VTPRLILASTSPRRRELLGLLGLPFEVVASRYDEDSLSPGSLTPPEYVTRLAAGKASEVAARTEGDALVIGADTTVILDGQTLNKPADAADARRMLRLLSDRTHQVYTGLCLVPVENGMVGAAQTDHAVTGVTFDALTDETIAAYVATGEPLDKAGAYGIQGKALSFIPGIQGDYFNVVGLPLEGIRTLLLPSFPDIAPAPSPPIFPDPTRYGRVREEFGSG
jgi:septum formation protein